jgi:hypothetical protein
VVCNFSPERPGNRGGTGDPDAKGAGFAGQGGAQHRTHPHRPAAADIRRPVLGTGGEALGHRRGRGPAQQPAFRCRPALDGHGAAPGIGQHLPGDRPGIAPKQRSGPLVPFRGALEGQLETAAEQGAHGFQLFQELVPPRAAGLHGRIGKGGHGQVPAAVQGGDPLLDHRLHALAVAQVDGLAGDVQVHEALDPGQHVGHVVEGGPH